MLRTFDDDVRTSHVVGFAALIAALATVASPTATSSRSPRREAVPNPATFQAVTVAGDRDSATTTPTPRPPNSLDAYREVGAVATDPGPSKTAAPDTPSSHADRWHDDPDVSWYGPGFYGGRTACGLAYTTTTYGVASRTLPCGTMITFRNPDNGRSITVPVIDRGPYVSGRQWDLSGATCVALDHCYTGEIVWRFANRGARVASHPMMQ